MKTSPILGAVFKLQRMRNRIEKIFQKREAALPDASSSPRVHPGRLGGATH